MRFAPFMTLVVTLAVGIPSLAQSPAPLVNVNSTIAGVGFSFRTFSESHLGMAGVMPAQLGCAQAQQKEVFSAITSMEGSTINLRTRVSEDGSGCALVPSAAIQSKLGEMKSLREQWREMDATNRELADRLRD